MTRGDRFFDAHLPAAGCNLLEQRLQQARQAFREKLGARLDELQELLRQAREKTPGVVDLGRAQRLAHKLCGSAGTFGLAATHAQMQVIDRALLEVIEGHVEPTDDLFARVETAIDKARRPER